MRPRVCRRIWHNASNAVKVYSLLGGGTIAARAALQQVARQDDANSPRTSLWHSVAAETLALNEKPLRQTSRRRARSVPGPLREL